MTVETGLVIVGGADDQLRLTNKKKRAELVTQTMVDKNIIEQIRAFLLGILLKQSQAAMERGEANVFKYCSPVLSDSFLCSVKLSKSYQYIEKEIIPAVWKVSKIFVISSVLSGHINF